MRINMVLLFSVLLLFVSSCSVTNEDKNDNFTNNGVSIENATRDSINNAIDSLKYELILLRKSEQQNKEKITELEDELRLLKESDNKVFWLTILVVVFFVVLCYCLVVLFRVKTESSSKPFNDEIGKLNRRIEDLELKVNKVFDNKCDFTARQSTSSSSVDNHARSGREGRKKYDPTHGQDDSQRTYRYKYGKGENKSTDRDYHGENLGEECILIDNGTTSSIENKVRYCIVSSSNDATVLEESNDKTQYQLFDINNNMAKFKYCGTFDFLKDNAYILEDVCEKTGVLSNSQEIQINIPGLCECIGNGKWKINKEAKIILK